MVFPHRFPSLINGSVLPALVLGSGMSAGYAPLVTDLLPLRSSAEQKLSINTGITSSPTDEPDTFYAWAQEVIEAIKASKNLLPYKSPKLNLAWALQMFENSRWLAEESLPLRGNTPRHRAIARLALEKRLHVLVSLNWDYLLEAAIESCGLPRDIQDPMRPGPYKAYKVLVQDADFSEAVPEAILKVIKPHGCIRALYKARRREETSGVEESPVFRVTKSELESIRENPGVRTSINSSLRARPLIGAGWAMSEPYIREDLATLQEQSPSLEMDRLSVLDLVWRPTHAEVAMAFKVEQKDAHFSLQRAPTTPNTDAVFQWIFAQYVIAFLNGFAPSPIRPEIGALKTLLESYPPPSWVIQWCDDFLPSWIRTCWRAGGVPFKDNNGMQIPSHLLSTGPRDYHIPIDCGGAYNQTRPDLVAAAVLLAALRSAKRLWVYDLYPGALWHEGDRELLIAVPNWINTDEFNDLEGIKPLIESMKRERGLAFVRSIKILPLGPTIEQLTTAQKRMLETSVRRQMNQAMFAAQQSSGDPFTSLADL